MPNDESDQSERPERARGFAIPGYASAAAKKGHELGRPYCNEWYEGDPRASASGRKGGRASVEARRRKKAERAVLETNDDRPS